MNRSRLLVIEPTLISARPVVDAARALGFEPVLLCRTDHLIGDAAEVLSQCEVHDVPTEDAAALLNWLRQRPMRDVAGVYTPADRYLPLAVQVAESLDVCGPDPAVTPLGDKAFVCQLVPEFSPAHAVVSPVSPDLAKLRELASAHGSLIFKPARSAGARGVFEWRQPDMAGLAERMAQEQAGLPGNPAWLAQTALPGSLASLEGVFQRGRMRVLGHSLRSKIGKAESINRFPAAAWLSADARSQMESAVDKLAQRSGFRQGFFHAEFMVEGERCCLIDANFGRLAGSGLGVQIGWAHGQSPAQTYAAAIDQCVFGGELGAGPDAWSPAQSTLAIHYGVATPTRVTGLHWRAEPAAVFHHRFRDLGNEVPPLANGSSAYIGVIIGADAAALGAIDLLELQTPGGPIQPCCADLPHAA